MSTPISLARRRAALRPRRTQAERSAATRALLLDATLQSLAYLGYANTTTTEVCRRAGVSQGALFKHFATKTDLLCRAAEELFASLRKNYRAGFAAAAAEGDPIAAATRLLATTFREPRLQAAFELYQAARTDDDLAESLRPVADAHAAHLRQLAREIFPEAAAKSPDFEPMIDVAVNALQGAAMGGDVLRNDELDERLLAFLTRLARAAFAARTDPTMDSPDRAAR
jgi:AcrR family transcriptional regulator